MTAKFRYEERPRTAGCRWRAAAVPFLLAVGLLFTGSLGASAADAPKPLDAPVKIVLGAVNSADLSPVALMAERLKKFNVELNIVKFVRYADARTALAAGSLDLATLGPADLPISVSRGIKNVVALMGFSTSHKYVVARKDVKLEKWSDLCGKKIGVAPGSAVWFQFVATLKEEGVNYSCLTPIQVQGAGNNMNIALKHGDIDAMVGWEPFESTPVVEGYGTWAMALDYSRSKAVGSQLGMLAGAAASLNDPKKKAAIERFVYALIGATAEVERDPKLKIDVIRDYTGLGDEIVKHIAKNMTFTPTLSLDQIQREAKLLHELGITASDSSGELVAYFQDELYRKYAK